MIQPLTAIRQKLRSLRPPIRTSIDEFLSRHPASSLTLDLGCGTSRYAHLFPKRIGVDLHLGPGVDVQADGRKLPFRDGVFRSAVCTELIEHVPEPSAVVMELSRVLEPGGRLLLTTPFCYPIHGAPHDFFRYTRHGLEYLFRDWLIESLDGSTTALGTLTTMIHAYIDEQPKFVRWCLLVPWLPLTWLFGKIHHYHSRRENLRPSPGIPSGYLLVARRR